MDYTIRPPMARSKGKQKNAFIRALIAIFPYKGDSPAEIFRKIIFIGAVAALLITGIPIISDVTNEFFHKNIYSKWLEDLRNSDTINISVDEIDKIKKQKPYIRDDFIGLYNVNSDLVGWFNLGGDEKLINEPVVQTDNNDVYLYTDFNKNYSKSGTLYVDNRCEFDEDGKSPNFTVIYGHWTFADSMFTKLNNYYYEQGNDDPDANRFTSYIKKYPNVYFDTLAENGTYKIFAACLFNTNKEYGEVYDYLRHGQPFTSKNEFNEYILDIMDRSLFFTDVDVAYGDEILCMSTCCYPFGFGFDNVRCAVFARKVRDGESAKVDTSKVMQNYNWIGWQQAIYYGIASPNGARKWNTDKLLSY